MGFGGGGKDSFHVYIAQADIEKDRSHMAVFSKDHFQIQKWRGLDGNLSNTCLPMIICRVQCPHPIPRRQKSYA